MQFPKISIHRKPTIPRNKANHISGKNQSNLQQIQSQEKRNDISSYSEKSSTSPDTIAFFPSLSKISAFFVRSTEHITC